MQNGYYAVTGAMVTQFNRLNQISNNLANMNTNGFKKDNEIVGDFMRIYQQKRDQLPLPNNTKEAAKFLNRSLNRVPRIVTQYKDFSMGPMVNTGNKLDVALGDKDLFFAVKTPDGIRLTRDGAFNLNKDGTLVTKDGYPVLSKNYFQNHQNIHIPSDAIDISIDKSGTIKTMDQTAIDTPIYQNRLMVVRMDNPDELKAVGDNYFDAKSSKVEKLFKIASDTSAVRQGMIEKSNVNPVREMTALIDTNRLVEMYQKAMTTQMDDLNNDAINKIAPVRA